MGISLIRRELENAVLLYGQQVDEFEGEDLHRIAYETRATLLALRDINYYFPDVPTASQEDYKRYLKGK